MTTQINYSHKKFYITGLAKEPCLQILEINTLAYYNAKLITAVKSFIGQGELKSLAFKYWKKHATFLQCKTNYSCKKFISQDELKSLVFKYWK